ncbi:MAG: hypothetical protein HQK65_11880 [Desulfamplus sp.]|nr:hypothetical protein [Desulfamplus sp.]
MATENDIVLVYLEDSPIFFARVEAIWPDVKKDWFNIELLVLQVPVKLIVWTLKDIYINGIEFFMGGKKMRMEVVQVPRDEFEMDEDNNTDFSQSKNTNPFGNKNSNKKNMATRGTEIKESQKESVSGADKSGQVVSLADFQKKKKDNN